MPRRFPFLFLSTICFLIVFLLYYFFHPLRPRIKGHNSKMEPEYCPFCKIAQRYPPKNSSIPSNPNPEAIKPNCFLILNTDLVMAFLDIMPISQGHVLVIPRPHREKIKDLKGKEGAALGMWLPIISRSVMRALGRSEGDWNIVQNNGAAAAQVVPHVHYHIIPRGGGVAAEVKARSFTMFGASTRSDLDESEAEVIASKIRKEVERDLEWMANEDEEGRKMLGKL